MRNSEIVSGGARRHSGPPAPHDDGDAICGLDVEGRIVFTTPALLRLLGREGDDLADTLLHDVVHRDPAGTEPHSAAACPFHMLQTPASSGTDTGFHRGDGTCIEVGYVVAGLDEGSARGAIVSFREVTGRGAMARMLEASTRPAPALSDQRDALRGHLAEAQERERLRIAADIHDDTLQALSAVALRLSTAGERASNDSARDLLAEAEIEIREVAQRLRRLVFALMPPDRDDDLRTAIESFGSVLFSDSTMTCELVGDGGPLGPTESLVAYRLIQEALRNAHAHSRGSTVRVVLRRTETELVARVSDDGIGFGAASAGPTHAGLRLVRERAVAAGGSAATGTGLDGRGCSIELRLPIDSEPPR